MRYLSWLFSFILHVTLFVILLQAMHLAPLTLEEVMEVDLTTTLEPEEVAFMPVPQPMEEPAIEEPQPKSDVTSTPLPLNKTVVLDDSPPPPIPPAAPPVAEPAPLPEPEPEITEISPVKVPKDTDSRRIVVRNDTTVHRGHEARFGRALMSDYYSYSSTQFSGQFTTLDDRTISIIDARNTKYGRFLIYDSKHKTLRRMKKFGKYVYTIGPSIYEDEPVFGSVTFLAKDDRIERFVLMTDDDRMAHYPRKVHVREDEVSFAASSGELKAYTSLPPVGENHPGVVFLHGNMCVEPSIIRGFTRALSARNVASLSFMPEGCAGDEGTPDSEDRLLADTRKALDHLISVPQVEASNAGLWGNGPGAIVAIRAATHAGENSPAYLVCLLDDSIAPEQMPDRATLAALPMPTLWLITGRETGKWHAFITQLEGLRDTNNKPFAIVVAPLKGSPDVLDAETDLSGWVEQVTEEHARLAVSWIRNLTK